MTGTRTPRDAAPTEIIDATTRTVEQDAGRAQALFRATGSGGDGVRSDIRIGEHAVLVDEPPALGGGNAAPNPVQFALASLLSCQVVTYRFRAARLGIPLDDMQVDVEGDLDVRGFFGLDDDVRPGFGAVRLVVGLRGQASEEDYQRRREAVDAHCPVLDLVRHPTPVTTRATS